MPDPYHITACSPDIFRAYDIRGIVDENLTPDIVYTLGLAIGTKAHQQGLPSIIVARDGRLSSDSFSDALIHGLTQTGLHVIDIGAVPTGVLYFACYFLNIGNAVMITGSHNPINYNGFKILFNFDALSEQGLQQLYTLAHAQKFHQADGSCVKQDVSHAYIDTITEKITLTKPLNIVIDCGNGITGHLAPRLFEKLGAQVTPLYCDVDGRFPNHHPNPSIPENMQDLIKQVKAQKADIGLAFDGDGDRLGVVTGQGEIIWPDRLMILFAQNILAAHPGETILYDVKCTRNIAKAVKAAGGQATMIRTGHSFMKQGLKKTGALFAGELSGHFCFKDDWYGVDDGLYSGARLLELLARDARPLSEIWQSLPDSIHTPEINIPLADDEKFIFMDKLTALAELPNAHIINIDGLRIEFPTGWALVRASNTTPCLVVRFEADSTEDLQALQSQIKTLLQRVKADLPIHF